MEKYLDWFFFFQSYEVRFTDPYWSQWAMKELDNFLCDLKDLPTYLLLVLCCCTRITTLPELASLEHLIRFTLAFMYSDKFIPLLLQLKAIFCQTKVKEEARQYTGDTKGFGHSFLIRQMLQFCRIKKKDSKTWKLLHLTFLCL